MSSLNGFGLPRIAYPISTSSISFTSSPRLLGRYTAGAGAGQEIDLGVFSIAGGTLTAPAAARYNLLGRKSAGAGAMEDSTRESMLIAGLDIANIFTLSQMINLNAVAAPAPPGGLAQFHLAAADTTASRFVLDSFAASGQLVFRRSNGSNAIKSALANNDVIGLFSGFGYGATGYSANARVGVNFFATEAWTDAAQGTRITFATNPNGSAAISTARWIVENDGSLIYSGGALTGVSTINALGYFLNGNTAIDANRIYRAPDFTFGTLPAAAATNGGRAQITDGAAAPVWNAAAAGGGAVNTPVRSTGAAWVNG